MKLYFDVDGTLLDSTTSAVKVWNMYWREPNQPMADASKIRLWNMSDQIPDITQDVCNVLFGCDYFFDMVKPYPYVKETLAYFKMVGHQIIFHSIGTKENLQRKMDYIEREFKGLYDGYIMMHNGADCRMDKSILNLSDGIMIDDNMANLNSCNARYKICAKMAEGEWNQNWHGASVKEFRELVRVIDGLARIDHIVDESKRA